MICFPNAKINLGLHILEKRPDGFHNIESVFYPIGLCDALEAVGTGLSPGFQFSSSGIPIPGDYSQNLCYKAYELIRSDYPLPGVKVHLHKHIPIGAGLGGGSSDGAHMIQLLDNLFELGLAWGEKHHYAKQLGSDCSFFISGKPSIVTGRGELMETINLSLKGYFLVLVCPAIHIGTAEAYQGVVPQKGKVDLETFLLTESPENWKNMVKNDFEPSILAKYTEIVAIKNKLYESGALYASLTGSGAAVYGLYKKPVELRDVFASSFVWSAPLW